MKGAEKEERLDPDEENARLMGSNLKEFHNQGKYANTKPKQPPLWDPENSTGANHSVRELLRTSSLSTMASAISFMVLRFCRLWRWMLR